MIIFDLSSLANDEHRRHFIEPTCKECNQKLTDEIRFDLGWHCYYPCDNVTRNEDFKPDYQAYYDACDKDFVIQPTKTIINSMFGWDYYDKQEDVHIWSYGSETFKEKTEKWLSLHSIYCKSLKMRPIDDTRPQEVLFEQWLDIGLSSRYCNLCYPEIGRNCSCHATYIHSVFSSHKPTIDMFRRRGIFVFDCNQER